MHSNTAVQTDAVLLQRARAFDLDALGEIYDTLSPAVFRYAYRQLGEQALAEDCVTETFSRFLTALKANGGPREYLKAYLFRVAHNWITDQFRASQAGSNTVSLDELLETTGQEPATDEDASPLVWVTGELNAQEVRAALYRLSPDQRMVVMMKFFEEMNNDEIASALNRPVGAVKQLQHRAFANLRKVLAPYAPGGVA
jgi:RNA polymerase sigma-70 factor (ECF subfamily)